MSNEDLTVAIFEITISNAEDRPHGVGRYGWRILVDDLEVASSFTNYETPEEAAAAIAWLRDNAHKLPVPEP